MKAVCLWELAVWQGHLRKPIGKPNDSKRAVLIYKMSELPFCLWFSQFLQLYSSVNENVYKLIVNICALIVKINS